MDTKQVTFGSYTFPVARITVGIRERAAEKYPDTDDVKHYLYVITECAQRALKALPATATPAPTFEQLSEEAETILTMDVYKDLVAFSYSREVAESEARPTSAAASSSPGQGS